ncbi:hypothetical protein OIU77_004987 [Salix suchowensis]|uniref:Uncharacterized protein n=1 Tax=Salix suchowensis TaxID=1278906 RepID=A0ABQ9AWG7_9ROSI|nr:hypothetical protein OIU77_004987 [Salix suchowensis]
MSFPATVIRVIICSKRETMKMPGIVKRNMRKLLMEVEQLRQTWPNWKASSLDELPCYNGREEDIFEAGYGETEYREACNRSELVHERSNESANTLGTVKETHADIIVHSSEDFAHSIDKTSDKQFRWFEEYGQQGEREPPSPELDHAHPFHFMNSLARKASSMNSQARKASQIATSFSKSETGDRGCIDID